MVEGVAINISGDIDSASGQTNSLNLNAASGSANISFDGSSAQNIGYIDSLSSLMVIGDTTLSDATVITSTGLATSVRLIVLWAKIITLNKQLDQANIDFVDDALGNTQALGHAGLDTSGHTNFDSTVDVAGNIDIDTATITNDRAITTSSSGSIVVVIAVWRQFPGQLMRMGPSCLITQDQLFWMQIYQQIIRLLSLMVKLLLIKMFK